MTSWARAVIALTAFICLVDAVAAASNSFGYGTSKGRFDILSDFRHNSKYSVVQFEEYPTSSTCAEGASKNAASRYYTLGFCIPKSSSTSEKYSLATSGTEVNLEYFSSAVNCTGTATATTTYGLYSPSTCTADSLSVGRKLVAFDLCDYSILGGGTTTDIAVYHWESGSSCDISSQVYPYYAVYTVGTCYALSSTTSVQVAYNSRDSSTLTEYSASSDCTGASSQLFLPDRLHCVSNTALWTNPERISTAEQMLICWIVFTFFAPLTAIGVVFSLVSTVSVEIPALNFVIGGVAALGTSFTSVSAGQALAIFPGLLFFYLMLYHYDVSAWGICLIGMFQVPIYGIYSWLATVLPLGFCANIIAMSPPGFALYHLTIPHQWYVFFCLFIYYASGSAVAMAVVGAAVGLFIPLGFPYIFGIHVLIFADTVIGKWATLLCAAAYCELLPVLGHIPANILISFAFSEMDVMSFENLMLVLAIQYITLLPVAGYPIGVIFYSIFLAYSNIPGVGILISGFLVSAIPGGFLLGWILFLVWVYEGVPS